MLLDEPVTCASTPHPAGRGLALSPLGPDDPFLINSTSGTTGLPSAWCTPRTAGTTSTKRPSPTAN